MDNKRMGMLIVGGALVLLLLGGGWFVYSMFGSNKGGKSTKSAAGEPVTMNIPGSKDKNEGAEAYQITLEPDSFYRRPYDVFTDSKEQDKTIENNVVLQLNVKIKNLGQTPVNLTESKINDNFELSSKKSTDAKLGKSPNNLNIEDFSELGINTLGSEIAAPLIPNEERTVTLLYTVPQPSDTFVFSVLSKVSSDAEYDTYYMNIQ